MAADQTVTATFDDALRSPACKVPKLRGKKLAAAKAAIKSAHCAVGKITRTYSAKVRQGRVISQKPAPGTRHPAGTRVRLVVSKGRRPA
jgi:beta-lactam-binding protein with PASTA domain